MLPKTGNYFYKKLHCLCLALYRKDLCFGRVLKRVLKRVMFWKGSIIFRKFTIDSGPVALLGSIWFSCLIGNNKGFTISIKVICGDLVRY